MVGDDMALGSVQQVVNDTFSKGKCLVTAQLIYTRTRTMVRSIKGTEHTKCLKLVPWSKYLKKDSMKFNLKTTPIVIVRWEDANTVFWWVEYKDIVKRPLWLFFNRLADKDDETQISWQTGVMMVQEEEGLQLFPKVW